MQKSVFQDNCMLPAIYWDNFLKRLGMLDSDQHNAHKCPRLMRPSFYH